MGKGKDGLALAQSCLQEASSQQGGKGHDRLCQAAVSLIQGRPIWLWEAPSENSTVQVAERAVL